MRASGVRVALNLALARIHAAAIIRIKRSVHHSVAQNPRHTLAVVTSSDMFAVIVRFQELTSYLNPLPGYFGRIDGGQLHSQSPIMHALIYTLLFLHVLFLFSKAERQLEGMDF